MNYFDSFPDVHLLNKYLLSILLCAGNKTVIADTFPILKELQVLWGSGSQPMGVCTTTNRDKYCEEEVWAPWESNREIRSRQEPENVFPRNRHRE